MLFNSIEYLIFLPVVLTIYFSVPRRFRLAVLVLASYYFYMSWKIPYIFLLLLSTSVDYWAGIRIKDSISSVEKKLYLTGSLLTNLSILFLFKYYNFFAGSVGDLLSFLQLGIGTSTLDFILPVGISFYTFQSLSYTIDIYRGDRDPENNFFRFALYVAFFPQLVAGPIERSTRLLPQFDRFPDFDLKRSVDGFKIMVWGFFLKVVVADRLSELVDTVYSSPKNFEGIPVMVATYFFSFQIYCDFAGYTNIARGTARILGYDLMKNFKRPYFSRSIPEFWRRWHISLSTWFRDYLYFPLGGNRCSTFRWLLNIMIVFLLSGLWHGAGWTFLFWGGFHGVFYLIYKMISKYFEYEKVLSMSASWIISSLKVVICFHLVTFSWIFFRADNFADAWLLIENLSAGLLDLRGASGVVLYSDRWGVGVVDYLLSIFLVIFLVCLEFCQGQRNFWDWLEERPAFFRWSFYYFIVISIIFLGVYGRREFIYFQF